MSKLFTEIEPKDIKRLGPDTLVKLLHRLLLCEARAMGLNSHGILVPYEITVPDGGSDGEWKANASTNEFIPRNWTRYQCKAEHITESKCRAEVAPQDTKGNFKAKARVREVLEAGGCFAFFSNDHEVKPSNDQDIDTVVRDQLKQAGVTPADGAIIEFFGCNRIANWTNKFPAAVRYIREVTQAFGGVHYRTFDGWGKLGGVSGTFFANEAINQKIKTIRDTLQAGKTRVIRMTGLSGVGKSRLVYEALKPSDDGDALQDSLSASCIYLSYETISTDLLGFIGHLADNSYAAVVIVDDCPSDIHDRIAGIVGNSLLSVVTIFHEPQQQRGDSHPLNLVPEEMEDVVEEILKGDAELAAKGESAIKAVASFAQGFPQIAKLIIEFHRAPTTDELNDRAKLFQKLLSRGAEPDKATLLTAQTLSLFRTIGGSATKLEADLSIIHELFCPDISEFDYRRSIQEQKKRRIVQQIADTLVLAPRPLGVALAADFISSFPTGKWKAAIEKLGEKRLLSEFQRRIEELEFSDQAEKLGKMFLEDGLPFNDAAYLLTGTTGSQMFRTLTVLSPSAAIKVAKRALSESSIEALRESKESRRELVRALELLVWEPDTFQDAADLLLKLAAAENEGWANNATGAFKQLFNLQLSGTKVPAIERLGVIKDGLESNEHHIKRVAIVALGSALNFRHFSRMGDTTLGGKRDAKLDWRPKSHREALDYWRECFLILHSRILADGEDKDAAQASLGKNITVVLQTPLLFELEPELKELCQHMNHLWPEVKHEIKTILDIHNDLTEAHKSALLRLKEYLTPAAVDLGSKLLDIVSEPGWHQRQEVDGSYTDVSREEAERFSLELAEKETDIVPFLPQLLLGEQQQGFSFGAILGKAHPRAKEIAEEVLNLWQTLDFKDRNSTFMRGLMHGLEEERGFRSKTLDRIAAQPALIDLLVPATSSIGAVSEEDFIRIRSAVVGSYLEPWRLRNLIQGLPLRMLPSAFLIEEFVLILEAKPESAQVLLEVLFLNCFGDEKRFKECSELFRTLLLDKGLVLGDTDFGWKWHKVALGLISITDDVEWLKLVSQFVCRILVERKMWVGTDYLSVVVSKLFEKAPVETWLPFGHAITSGDDFQKFVFSEFLGNSGIRFDDAASPLWSLPEIQFRSWVKANPTVVPLILNKISLYTVEKLEDEQHVFKWHPHALVLLREGADENELAHALMRNLFSFGSTGSRVPYLEKRLNLVNDLFEVADARLIRILRPVQDWLAEEIERTKREELNENARFR